MKMGAEPKKLAALIGLVAVAGAVYWMNSSDSPAPAAPTHPADAAAIQAPAGGPRVVKRRTATGRPGSVGDKVFAAPPTVDPAKVDPTLRLDLLAKVQAVGMEGGARNIFAPGSPPPPPGVAANLDKLPKAGKINVNAPAAAVTPPPVQAAALAATTANPAINLKYYGYSTKRSDGEKKAFFLDGEDVIVAAEGEIIKKQYKIIRIGVNSVQMEDTHSKSTQTLPLLQEAAPA